jgi:hypothetical protein
MRKPNRYRCETCKSGEILVLDASKIPGERIRYPIVYACKRCNNRWMPDGGTTWDVGCASHSDLVEWDSQRLIGDIDKNYKDYKFREIWNNNKIPDQSTFFDGWIYGRLAMLKELGI